MMKETDEIIAEMDTCISDENWMTLKKIFDECPQDYRVGVYNFLDYELNNAIDIGMARTAEQLAKILQVGIGPKQLINLKGATLESGDIDDYIKALELMEQNPTFDDLNKLMEYQIRLGYFTKAKRIVDLRGTDFTIEELRSFLLVFARQKRITYQEQVNMRDSNYEELITFLDETESRPVRV